MITHHIILATAWICYCFVHSLLADEGIKRQLFTYLGIGKKAYLLLYNLVALSGLTALLLFQVNIVSVPVFGQNAFMDVLSGLFLVSGAWVMLACIRKYFGQLSGVTRSERSVETLEVTGIHRHVRHPLYAGTFILLAVLRGCH